MPVCDVIAAGCGCKVQGAGSNSVGARRSIHWTDVLAAKQARGAGVVTTGQEYFANPAGDLLAAAFAPFKVQTVKSWESVPETAWPTGTVAKLAEPFTVGRGPYATALQVTRFVKKSSGRWFSDPGADVSFASLFELAGRAVIAEVDVPFGATDPQTPEAPQDAPERSAPNIPPADADVDEQGDAQDALDGVLHDAAAPVKDADAQQAEGMSLGVKIGLGIGALALVGAAAWWLSK